MFRVAFRFAAFTAVFLSTGVAGARPNRHVKDDENIGQMRAMLLKYAARCALEPNQKLSPPADAGSPTPQSFPGLIGVAPEWLDGTCDLECQQRVSSCLLALVNRTGRHVSVSLSSAAPSLLKKMSPNADDRPFPHQEGAFFGNVWTGQAFSCQGAQVKKGPQVKRFCASNPDTCGSGSSIFIGTGTCADACQMRCFPIGGGEQRCAAVSCRDPQGHVWDHPITVFMRNKIEAANADDVASTQRLENGLRPGASNATATFNLVDFGGSAADRVFVGELQGAKKGAQVEVWLDESRKLGAATVAHSKPGKQTIEIPLKTKDITGPNRVVLRLLGGGALGLLTDIDFR
jgi:hypothetical protein